MEALQKMPTILTRQSVLQCNISPKFMRHQTIHTLYQQCYLTNLIGLDFDVVYQPRKSNTTMYASSRLPDDSFHELQPLSQPVFTILTILWGHFKYNPKGSVLFS